MEIEDFFLIAFFSMLISIGAIGWMLYHSHVRNREIMIQRDQIQDLQHQTFEMEKLKSIAAAEEEQMRRIGRFLHDEVGGNLHVLLHMLENSSNTTQSDLSDVIQKASLLARKSIDSVRITSQELVPYFLLNFGLTRTLQSMADDSIELPGVTVTYSESLEWSPDLLEQEMKIHVYRLVQEVYSNILRHAKPSRIHIHFYTDPAKLGIELAHNGVGLSQQEFSHLLQSGKSLGLKNIDYRLKLLNAGIHYSRTDENANILISLDCSEMQLSENSISV
jgi:two-component system NarL family sensor kinase